MTARPGPGAPHPRWAPHLPPGKAGGHREGGGARGVRESLPVPLAEVWGAPGRYPERKGPPAASRLLCPPAPPRAAVPSPTPQAPALRADHRRAGDASGAPERVSAFPPRRPAHCAGERTATHCRQRPTPRSGRPRPRPGRSPRVVGQRPGEEGGRRGGCESTTLPRKQAGWGWEDDGLGVRHQSPASARSTW